MCVCVCVGGCLCVHVCVCLTFDVEILCLDLGVHEIFRAPERVHELRILWAALV